MTTRFVIVLLVALTLAGCARGSLPQTPTTSAKDDSTTPHLMLRFAVYFLPKAKVDAAALARELAKKKYPHLALIDGPGDTRRPAVAIVPTEIEKFPPPSRKQLELFSRGVDPARIDQVVRSKQVLVFLFLAKGKDRMHVHREALELVGSVAERADGVVWDEDTRELFSPARWRNRHAAAREALPDIQHFITVHGYREDEDGLARLVTLGMAKFGLPDIALENVPISSTRAANGLVNLVCQTLFERSLARPSAKLTVELAAIRSPGFKRSMNALQGAGRGEVTLASVRPEPGDADNALYEIVFPDASGPKKQEAMHRLLGTVFGFEDAVIPMEHDQELLDASRRARARLLQLKSYFQAGLKERELIQIKLPFAVPEGGNEWMWVELVEWNGKVVRGILQNTPFSVPNLTVGARVEGSEDDVFDYIFLHADGTEEGNETGRIMQKRSSGQ